MMYVTLISRITDGQPLSSNTDSKSSVVVTEIFKHMKLMSRIANRLPDRCSYIFDSFTIHLISALGLSFAVVCDTSFPPVLAFAYLTDIQKEFIQLYEKKAVESANRPYCFIEFDSNIHRIKQSYNNIRSQMMKPSYSALNEELKLRPPHILSPEELLPSQNVQSSNSSSTHVTVATLHRYGVYMPLHLQGLLSIGLCLFCSGLNLTRGLHVVNDAHLEDYFSDHYQYAFTFFVCCMLSLYQIYLICVPVGQKRALACATLGSICLCQLYLWEYRNNYMIIFHVMVACYGTYVIFTRQLQQKLPQYTL